MTRRGTARAATLLAALQSGLGVGVAGLLGVDPLLGLVCGSVSMTGEWPSRRMSCACSASPRCSDSLSACATSLRALCCRTFWVALSSNIGVGLARPAG